jgi:hypothetical protein
VIQVYPDDGLLQGLLQYLPTNLWYWLYSNNFAPDQNSTIGSFTVDTNFPGVAVPASAFTLQSLAAHVAHVTAADIAMTNGGGSTENVYGYFATDGISGGLPSGKLFLAAQFDSPPLAVVPGGSLPITPTISLKMGS